MDERTLIALKASIEKWEKNAVTIDFGEIKVGPIECPLCELFNYDIDQNCRGCPVFEKTNSIRCKNTPYMTADSLYDKLLRSMLNCWDEEEIKLSPLVKQSTQLFRKAALEEVEFLKSLLPNDS